MNGDFTKLLMFLYKKARRGNQDGYKNYIKILETFEFSRPESPADNGLGHILTKSAQSGLC